MEDDYASPWDNFQSIIASDLGVSAAQIDGTATYPELGGTSINILSTILKLQQSGHAVTVEDLIQQDLKSLGQSSSFTEVTAKNKYHFAIKRLKDAEPDIRDRALTLIGECFTKKCPMFSMNGNMTTKDFVSMFKTGWSMFSEYSIMVVDGAGFPRAASLNADNTDLANGPTDHIHPHFLQICEMLESVTAKAEMKYNPRSERGITFCILFIGTAVENTPEENIIQLNMMEVEAIRLAEANRFHIVLAENVHPTTQQISKHLGYIRFADFFVNQYKDSKGDRPLASCPDDFKMTVDIFETANIPNKQT